MPSAPAASLKAVAFDLLGTIYPITPLRDGITALGLPPAALEAWLTAAQRDTLALAVSGEVRPFFDIMNGALDAVLADHALFEPAYARAALMEELANLQPHPEATDALAMLKDAGVTTIALSKRPAAEAVTAIEDPQLSRNVVSMHDVRRATPQGEIFGDIARAIGAAPAQVALVTAHPWMVNGASAAGFRTAWLAANRPYPQTMRAPDVQGARLPAVVQQLLSLGRLEAAS